jgi:signal peptidase I
VPEESSLDEGASRSSLSTKVSEPAARKPKKHMPVWQETILLLGIALVLAVVIKAFLLQAFYIPSQSMEPGLIKNDRILVEKVSYWGDDTPRRGDVIVFEDPGGWLNERDTQGPTTLLARGLAKVGLYPTGGHLVKRVIGVEGDVVVCCDKEGRLSVNGQPIDEPYVMKGAECAAPAVGCKLEAGPIPEGHLFVMGDNRDNSADSSLKVCREDQTDCSPTRGFVPAENVVGKVFALVWPQDRWTRISTSDSFEDVPASP